MIKEIAAVQGRNDETLNIALAVKLCETKDREGIKEIVAGLKSKDKAIVGDCIKVLYELGARAPELVAEYTVDFLEGLKSKNNRLVWGCMTALAEVVELKPKEIEAGLGQIIKAYEEGSVITRDNSMTVFAKLCKVDRSNEKIIFPLLMKHLENCRSKEVPQHAERISICINDMNKDIFKAVLIKRKEHLSPAGIKRIERLLK